MGNKEGKFKKVFEEIDASGDGRVSRHELAKFLDIDQNPRIMEVFFADGKLDNAEIKVIAEGVAKIRENDKDGDGKLTFDEFVLAMKANEKMNKLFLKIVED